MATLMTGATGYLGGYTLLELLERSDEPVFLLIRGGSARVRLEKLWKGLQLHIDLPRFESLLPRLRLIHGDLLQPGLGIAAADRASILDECDAIYHGAASLNRMSARVCVNANVRGTIGTLELAREMHQRGTLRRYTFVSTAAVVGDRRAEHLLEDESLDFNVPALDPYARTKRICAEIVQRLLPDDVSRAILRPVTVMGDSRHPRTTSFEMPAAFVWLANMPLVPMKPDTRIDIVNADWVGRASAAIHLAPDLEHRVFFLSAGRQSPSARVISEALESWGHRKLRFAPWMANGFFAASRAGSRLPRGNPVQGASVLLKVFWPYIVSDVTHDNTRAVEVAGEAPTPFEAYCSPYFQWVSERRMSFPYTPLPERIGEQP